MARPQLLYLVHRIPFPPNKGDKIRSYNFLKYLSEVYDIHLGTFIDDDNDLQYISDLGDYCKSVHVERIHPLMARLKSLKGLLTGQALTLTYYHNRRMRQWVDKTLSEKKIDSILVFSAAVAQFVEDSRAFRVIDFVDIDSDKWRQYAKEKTWPLNWIYAREGRVLLDYEKVVTKRFDRAFFVSRYESRMFQGFLTEGADKVHFVNNGVDYDYFSPEHAYTNPYKTSVPKMVFVGAMDYWPNIDAVAWFARNLFPAIRKRAGDEAEFYIVGSNPTEQVLELNKLPGVFVTGRVEDVRPYVAFSDLVVATLRIARGVQNKVLEAMAMDKPILATMPALEGIEHENRVEAFALDAVNDMVEYALSHLNSDQRPDYSGLIRKHYDWKKNCQQLQRLLVQGKAPQADLDRG
jgi:sugar transferase (PEP-CTERM/EpsH1 system associated)